MGEAILFKDISVVNMDGAEQADVLVADGQIAEVATQIKAQARQIDGSGKILMPGFIDIHMHGAAGFDVMDANAAALSGIAHALPQEGVTAFLATTMTQTGEHITRAVRAAGKYTSAAGEAELLGIHLEGPYLSPHKAGAQNPALFQAPNAEQFENWQIQSSGKIRIVTLAPELDGADDFIELLNRQQIIASIGHSDASYEQALGSGASHVTHLFNQMSGFHHREPGVVGAAMLDGRFRVELIADLIHSHPASVELAYRQIAAERLVLVTDAMRAKGLAFGDYELGGQQVSVGQSGARLESGSLAGSVLSMDEAIRNIQGITHCGLPELVRMSSYNAAESLGLSKKGHIAKGMDADIVMLSSELTVEMTLCRGEIAFIKK